MLETIESSENQLHFAQTKGSVQVMNKGVTCQDALEGKLDVARVQGRGLDKGKSVLGGELLGLVSGDGTKMTQIAFVTDKHNHNVVIGVVAKLLEPAANILIGSMLGNIVDQQGTDGTAVVSRSDSTVTLLSG